MVDNTWSLSLINSSKFHKNISHQNDLPGLKCITDTDHSFCSGYNCFLPDPVSWLRVALMDLKFSSILLLYGSNIGCPTLFKDC